MAKKPKKINPEEMSVEDLFNHSEACEEPIHMCDICDFYMNTLAKLDDETQKDD